MGTAVCDPSSHSLAQEVTSDKFPDTLGSISIGSLLNAHHDCSLTSLIFDADTKTWLCILSLIHEVGYTPGVAGDRAGSDLVSHHQFAFSRTGLQGACHHGSSIYREYMERWEECVHLCPQWRCLLVHAEFQLQGHLVGVSDLSHMGSFHACLVPFWTLGPVATSLQFYFEFCPLEWASSCPSSFSWCLSWNNTGSRWWLKHLFSGKKGSLSVGCSASR